MLKELDRAEFDAFSSRCPCTSFTQTSGWADVKRPYGWEADFWGLEKGGSLQAAALVLHKTFLRMFTVYYSPRGFLLDYSREGLLQEFTREMTGEIRRRGGCLLKADPYVEQKLLDLDGNPVPGGFDNTWIQREFQDCGYLPQAVTTAVHTIFLLDLEGKDERKIKSSFTPTLRNEINRTVRYGIRVREMRRDELPVFYDLMNATAKRRSFVNRPLEYYQSLYDALHKQGIVKFLCAEMDLKKYREDVRRQAEKVRADADRLSARRKQDPSGFHEEGRLAEDRDQLRSAEKREAQLADLMKQYGETAILSVNMDYFWGDEILVCFGGNDEKLLGFHGQTALYWEMIREALRQGKKRFNFYGIPDSLDPEDEMYGVYATKRPYGGRVSHLLGEYNYPVRPFLYRLYMLASSAYFRLRDLRQR